ncbi:(2Fe-2S)-binding protein [Rhodococcus opacus]|uniref:4-hydroxybenzoyl-CoA reductase subunit gamma n=1 Tax=Rhodococcus opacus TaxID=37919 RepID=A0A2S8J8R1_RHOOP|nr:(2Fe-2S)-binding protein [Rhodococcus opacus]PQP23450.1 4-hydroxybenzoyl-CoA reductase subunit gamma [Rhodococcus opacus]
MRIELTVNGERAAIDIEPRKTLADALREDLGLTGTHLGCEHGVCGACTVLVDGGPVRACLMFAVQADGSSVTTVEGMAADDGTLHPLQRAFCDRHGLQCGFCTPGMLMSALDLLHREVEPTRERIREEMSGNICRCTGYVGIVDAVEEAAAEINRIGTEPAHECTVHEHENSSTERTSGTQAEVASGPEPSFPG